MARSYNGRPKWFQSKPGVYARTTAWSTSYYHQKTGGMLDYNLLGLNTAFDDLHKKEGESPYLRNIRFFGEDEVTQRSQAMSRLGARLAAVVGEKDVPLDRKTAETTLELYEGKAIEWDEEFTDRITGITVALQNTEVATGYVKISFRDYTTKAEISNVVIDLSTVVSNGFSEHTKRPIVPFGNGKVSIRMEIIDDLDTSDCAQPIQQRKVRVLADGRANHRYAMYKLPNVDMCLHEKAIEFTDGISVPIIGYKYNNATTIPRTYDVCAGGKCWVVFPVVDNGIISLWRMDKENGAVFHITDNVDPKATTVRYAQADGELYYVDGYSELQKINLTTWAASIVVPIASEIDTVVNPGASVADLTPKKGASLIHFLRNRLYLSGFDSDPNMVIFSLIDSVKPRYSQYNDRFYSPDESPKDTSCEPVTAIANVDDNLIVFRREGLSIFTAPAGFEAGKAQEITPEGSQIGVLNQEAVAQGRNNVYFYNKSEGICRFGGSVNQVVSMQVENIVDSITDPENVFMMYHANKIRFYFAHKSDHINNCLVYYLALSGSSPWYYDNNTPVIAGVSEQHENTIYGLHSYYPAIMQVDSQHTDFGSIITAEYSTQYHFGTDPNIEKIVKRVDVNVLANSTSSYYIGVDTDYEDDPVVYRRYIEARVDGDNNPDAVFGNTAEAGYKNIHIRGLFRGRTVQVRVLHHCYKSRMELMSVTAKYGDRDNL